MSAKPETFDPDEVRPLDSTPTSDGDSPTGARLSGLGRGWQLSTWVAFWLLILFAALTLVSSAQTVLGLWVISKPLAIVLGSVGGIAFAVLLLWILRELRAIFSFRRNAKRQQQAYAAIEQRDEQRALSVLPGLERQFQDHKAALGDYRSHRDGSPTALEKLDLFERTVLAERDAVVEDRIVAAARDSALFTAISPFASLDVAISLWRNLRMIREIAEIYGLAPGWRQTAGLLRRALFQGVVAGGMEAGDGLLNNILGGSLAGQLSAKLGEGMVNGLMTTRIGIATMEQCRPLPHRALPPPSLSELGTRVVSQVGKQVTDSVGGAVGGLMGRGTKAGGAPTKTPDQIRGSSASTPIGGRGKGPEMLDEDEVKPL